MVLSTKSIYDVTIRDMFARLKPGNATVNYSCSPSRLCLLHVSDYKLTVTAVSNALIYVKRSDRIVNLDQYNNININMLNEINNEYTITMHYYK